MTQQGHRCPKCDDILNRAEEQKNKANLAYKENVIKDKVYYKDNDEEANSQKET